jgi:hypothetical protein
LAALVFELCRAAAEMLTGEEAGNMASDGNSDDDPQR